MFSVSNLCIFQEPATTSDSAPNSSSSPLPQRPPPNLPPFLPPKQLPYPDPLSPGPGLELPAAARDQAATNSKSGVKEA
ncbi:unnamed protein product [Linum trigynum]|uniref:Uncharacterized protein n=1 Tax=Linum trigynum TaxID=586398 RepID=A0AAV2CWM1_9ROSI